MVSKEVIDEIIMRNDIESLIGGYVSLRRAGTNLKGLCPFHSEKTPSFTVYPADNSFYCFGCGVGGDAITFIKKMEHLDYPDALEFLAKRAGITIPISYNNLTGSNAPRIDKKRIYEMNVDAAKYFNRNLFSNDEKARAALRYFTDSRGLSLSTIKHFGLGYASDSFDAFSKYMRAKGYSYEELVVGFLCGKSENGRYYDAFRNRVMFPIIDVSGNVIAFGGRVMDDSKPKYKNSSDTPVFKKSRNLFALNFAKNFSEDAMILCEGYMDVIALHAAGFSNAVATLGTAITAEQARVLSRYTKRIIISYDADEAGQKAAKRAIQLLSEVGLDVSVLRIPDAKDPDEYIKKYGKESFMRILTSTKSKFEYNVENILTKYNIDLPQDKINAINELEKMISEVYSSAERDVYIQSIAKRLSVDYKSMRTDIERLVARRQSATKRAEEKKIKDTAAGYSDKINPDFVKAPAIAKNEENVLGILLLYPEKMKLAISDKLLSESDFFTEFNKRVFCRLKESYDKGEISLDMVFNEDFSPEETGRIARMRVNRMSVPSGSDDVLIESIDILRKSLEKKKAKSITSIEELDAVLKRIRKD